ncbi:MAG: hypothetical protein KUA35_12080 [Pseudodesulfovibrio sp.]|uniref:STAS/SEC14 domain-containing protein n=1 Tax=Pseudodesulfovibrio aespoeensis (strain ATCC 700646 / DSM 10631 / Aspo-2) TaxID=643562 RepID=E6VZX7_PSEA9|nr:MULTISPECIES: hypothetical protein [Pseudodesulfovibrio]MBU4190854.1 hypothetical protein [Pseudomonadota bacterium]ADU64059.1 hypothetical protein Daes_3067 [Pseudodesulfovibrio aespoeensis Aspo-2]MBU4244338.1 hypothetical protein [Pseudomonadota bacterium]MBU4378445.1 hypothetical protein [Pseudomonadota bacterium]MBU4476537.1 hypothetical protein [Pseudomonadota bacterium]
MPLTTTFTVTDRYLLVIAQGAAQTADELTEYALSLVEEARKTGQTRILLDETRAAITPDTFDIVLLADRLDALRVANLGIRTAAVCAPDNCEVERSIETALRNRSISYRVFDDKAAAEAWLLA